MIKSNQLFEERGENRMRTRLRMAKVIFGASFAVVAATMFFSIKERPKFSEVQIKQTDLSAEVESTNVKLVSIKKERRLDLKADKFFKYPDNRPIRMMNVSAVVDGHNSSDSQISIEADKMLIYEKTEKQPERIVWSGSVRAVSGDRVILASQMTYTPSEKKYVFTGSPIKVLEKCRETTAEEMTINDIDGTIMFRGENYRTMTTFKEDCEDNVVQKEASTASFLIILGR